MASERVMDRQMAAPDRRPPGASAPIAAPPVSAAQALHRRLGNQGLIALAARRTSPAVIAAAPTSPIAAAPLRVSSSHDATEREASAVAAQVIRAPTPSPVAVTLPTTLHRAAASPSPAGGAAAPAPVTAQISQSLTGGAPLPAPTRAFMEPRFGADFSQIRVHTDNKASQLNSALNAKAFTVGGHIFFGKSQYRPETAAGKELIAHELAHTVQQGKAPQAQVHRAEGDFSLFDISPSGLVTAAIGFVAPRLKEYIDAGPTGVFDKLKSFASSAIEGVFSTLMAPVRVLGGAGQALTARFAPMLQVLQVAGAQIAKNDCTPIRDAAAKIESTAVAIVTPVVEFVQPIVAKIKDFLDAVWDKIGAPIWDWIKDFAKFQWDTLMLLVKWIGDAWTWIWDKTKPIRDVYVNAFSAAWKWLKDKLGIGDEAEGKGGLLQWAQNKLAAAWAPIKEKLGPFWNQIKGVVTTAGTVALALSPAGPILAIGAVVPKVVKVFRWVAANWGKGDILVQSRIYIEKTLLPEVVDTAQRLGGAVARVAQALGAALGQFAAGLAAMVKTVGGSVLSFAVSAVQWLSDQANVLATWVTDSLGTLQAKLVAALNGLEAFARRAIHFLKRVADVYLDIWGLPILLGETIWNAVPACIRDPIVDFLGPIILKQIELFQELAKDNETWQKTKADIQKLIKLVFHDHDLMGAVKAAFHLVLRVFNLPPDLLVQVAQKAMVAWDIVIKKPLNFIKNAIRVVGVGFRILWEDKIEALKLGLQGWLLGEIKDKDIVLPTDWTSPRQLFDFVLSVLGLNENHLYDLLKETFPGREKDIDRVRAFIGKVKGIVAWVDKAIDTTKSPKQNAEEMVNQGKEFGKSVLTGLAEWVAAKVAEEIAIMVAAAAASAGLSELVDIARRIYKALVTAVKWARRILDMISQTLDKAIDIATGKFEGVGATLANMMKTKGMPFVIGVLADQVGLGGVGAAIREQVDKLRKKVDDALRRVFTAIKKGLEGLFNLVKAGVQAVKDWWKERVSFSGADGEKHDLYVEGTERSAKLMVKSDAKEVDAYLRDVIKDKDADAVTKADAKKALDFYEKTLIPLMSQLAKETNEEAKKTLMLDFPPHLTTFSRMLMKVVGANVTSLPTDPPLGTWNAPSSSRLEKVSSRNVKPGPKVATGDTPAYLLLQRTGLTTSKGWWKRMHMITHQVGGVPTADNWVPAPVSVNSGNVVRGFELSIEEILTRTNKETHRSNLLWIYVHALSYHSAFPTPPNAYGERDFVKSLRFEAGIYYQKAKKDWVKDPKPVISVSETIPSPSADLMDLAVDVNQATATELSAGTGAPHSFCTEVKAVRDKYQGFSHINDFMEKMIMARVAEGTARTPEFQISIYAFNKAHYNGTIRFGAKK